MASYFRRNKGVWIPSGEIQRLVTSTTKYSPANATRRLRELVEDGTLEVEYRKPRNHAYYRYIPQVRTVERVIVEGNQAKIIREIISV